MTVSTTQNTADVPAFSSSPAVSVVIATYNYGCFISEALESVLQQSMPDFEVVIVDDGSTDDTSTIVERYSDDPRISYHVLNHAGQPAAKNAGIRISRAPLIAFLDADDRWLPTKLERQLQVFRRDPELGVVCTGRRFIDEFGHSLVRPPTTLYRGEVLAEMFRTNFVCFSSSMVRREALDKIGLFDESLPLAIDYDLWLRMATAYRFDYVDEPLVEYRTGHANLSRRAEERLSIALQIMDRFVARGGAARLSREVLRRAYAETYCHMGYVRRSKSRISALVAYLRAISAEPLLGSAWYELASLFVPERCRRGLRALRNLLRHPTKSAGGPKCCTGAEQQISEPTAIVR